MSQHSSFSWWSDDARLGWAMFVVLGVFVGLPLAVGYLLFEMIQPPSADQAVMAGGRMRILAVWTPDIVGTPQESIVVLHTNQQAAPELSRRATRAPRQRRGAPMAAFTHTHLTPEQWEAIDQLRGRWCADPPAFATMSWFSREPFYDVGLNCSTRTELSYRRVKVPVDVLPPELEMLLEVIPSGLDWEHDPYPGLLHPSARGLGTGRTEQRWMGNIAQL